MKRRLTFALTLVGTLACGLTVAWSRAGEQNTTVRVESGEIHSRLVVQAMVVAEGGIAEVRPRMEGTVLRVLVSEGTRVRAGQVLAELDSDELRANVVRSRAEVRSLAAAARAVATGAGDGERSSLEAEVAVAREQLEQAKDRARSSTQLHQEGAESAVSAQEATRAEAIARVQLARAEARLRQARAGGTHNDVQAARERVAAAAAASQAAQLVLDRSRMVSTIEGVVLSRHIDPGDTVRASGIDALPAFEIADVDRTELRLEIEEQDGQRLGIGQTICVQLPGGKVTLGHGKIVRLGARVERRTIGADEGRVRADSKVRVAWAEWAPSAGQNLSLGQRAEAVVELPAHRVETRLPRRAVVVHDGQAWVSLPGTLGRAERPVTLGQIDNLFVEVLNIAAGTEVLSNPSG